MRAAIWISGLAAVAACGGGGGTEPAPASTVTITVPSTDIASGSTVQASATITVGSGAPTPFTGEWRTSNNNIATVTQDGVIRGVHSGSANVTVQQGSSMGLITVKVVPGAAYSINIYAGNGQAGATNTGLADPLCTTVTDFAGNLIIGASVMYVVASGGGSINPPGVVTDDRGIATSHTWILGPTVGTQTVTASAGDLHVTFSATAQ